MRIRRVDPLIFLMEKINVDSKSSEFISILNDQFQGKINLARLKLISIFVITLCKVQTVGFEKLANAFDTEAKAESSLRRIQRFIAPYVLDSDLIAKLIFSLLPEKENLKLSIEKTNWQFGQTDINIFMLGAVYKGLAFRCYSICLKNGAFAVTCKPTTGISHQDL
ncbi:hypothetical protein EYV94_06345 [Puteibacter caeruleilacunae]|nr:hypothetical protein EYV94_06345 [Puteibacter caeruleilacunae]